MRKIVCLDGQKGRSGNLGAVSATVSTG